MAKTLSQILAKLDKPPAAHNWALCNHQEKRRTTSSLVNLAMGFPTISYQWATLVIQNVLADGLDDERAVQNLDKICPASQLKVIWNCSRRSWRTTLSAGTKASGYSTNLPVNSLLAQTWRSQFGRRRSSTTVESLSRCL